MSLDQALVRIKHSLTALSAIGDLNLPTAAAAIQHADTLLSAYSLIYERLREESLRLGVIGKRAKVKRRRIGP